MKNVIYVLRWVVTVIALAALVFVPDMFAVSGLTLGANFITSSLTYTAKENLDLFLRPMFIGKSPWETGGVTVRADIQGGENINYIGTANKLLLAYANGFSGASATTHTQRTWSVVRLKAECAEDSVDFYKSVTQQLLNKGEWDDLTGTELFNIVLTVFTNAVKSDIYRDITRGLPFEDNTFDIVYMHHVLEHIHTDDDFFFVINEIGRVLKPEGTFDICVPPYTFEGAYSDPTHCRVFTPRTFDIICGNNGGWNNLQQITVKFKKVLFEEIVSPKDSSSKEYHVKLTKI